MPMTCFYRALLQRSRSFPFGCSKQRNPNPVAVAFPSAPIGKSPESLAAIQAVPEPFKEKLAKPANSPVAKSRLITLILGGGFVATVLPWCFFRGKAGLWQFCLWPRSA